MLLAVIALYFVVGAGVTIWLADEPEDVPAAMVWGLILWPLTALYFVFHFALHLKRGAIRAIKDRKAT